MTAAMGATSSSRQRRRIKRGVSSVTIQSFWITDGLSAILTRHFDTRPRVFPNVSTVVRWRDRYAREGLAGLEDRPRSGRTARLRAGGSAADRGDGHQHAAPPLRRLVAPADRRSPGGHGHLRFPGRPDSRRAPGQAAPGPRLADPARRSQFFTKAAEVCALHRSCPPCSVVVSWTRKPRWPPVPASTPTSRPVPGGCAAWEFEYIRHGTVSVTAALDVHTGQIVVEELPRNDSAHFIQFLARLERCLPAGLTAHLVLDNGSSRTSKATRAWLAEAATRRRLGAPHRGGEGPAPRAGNGLPPLPDRPPGLPTGGLRRPVDADPEFPQCCSSPQLVQLAF